MLTLGEPPADDATTTVECVVCRSRAVHQVAMGGATGMNDLACPACGALTRFVGVPIGIGQRKDDD